MPEDRFYPEDEYHIVLTGPDGEPLGSLSTASLRVRMDYRPVYAWAVRDASGAILETGTDLEGASEAGADPIEAMEALLSFLGAAAEAKQGFDRTGLVSENLGLFNPATTEWAAQHSDELAMRVLQLSQDPDLPPDRAL